MYVQFKGQLTGSFQPWYSFSSLHEMFKLLLLHMQVHNCMLQGLVIHSITNLFQKDRTQVFSKVYDLKLSCVQYICIILTCVVFWAGTCTTKGFWNYLTIIYRTQAHNTNIMYVKSMHARELQGIMVPHFYYIDSYCMLSSGLWSSSIKSLYRQWYLEIVAPPPVYQCTYFVWINR